MTLDCCRRPWRPHAYITQCSCFHIYQNSNLSWWQSAAQPCSSKSAAVLSCRHTGMHTWLLGAASYTTSSTGTCTSQTCVVERSEGPRPSILCSNLHCLALIHLHAHQQSSATLLRSQANVNNTAPAYLQQEPHLLASNPSQFFTEGHGQQPCSVPECHLDRLSWGPRCDRAVAPWLQGSLATWHSCTLAGWHERLH